MEDKYAQLEGFFLNRNWCLPDAATFETNYVKYEGAQQIILANIPVKFDDSRSNGFWVRHATKLVIIYVKSTCQGQ